jgi:aspartate/methionine/tyrosine aminotransferase
MTGWRLGYLVVPEPFIRPVQALQQNLFISPPDFAQDAALAALDAADELEAMRQRFDERRRYLLSALPAIGLEIPATPHGAFYVFADASAHTSDSMAFAVELLEGARVAVTPGIDFGPGGEGYLRFSYATSLDRIREGVRRLGDYLATRPAS